MSGLVPTRSQAQALAFLLQTIHEGDYSTDFFARIAEGRYDQPVTDLMAKAKSLIAELDKIKEQHS